MVTKKVLLTSILTTSCLFSILFMTFPTRSSSEEYDPWADVSGPTIGEPDGTINMRDIQYEILHFNTFGTPVNRTSLLEAQSQIENLTTLILELQSRMDSLNATVIEQQNTINTLNQTVVYLDETVAILNSTGLGAPDYDSGWFSIAAPGSVLLTHNLGTTELLVYVIGNSSSGTIHQYGYGCDSYGPMVDNPPRVLYSQGVYWERLTTTSIYIQRLRDDGSSNGGGPELAWDNVRVMLWKIPQL